MRLETGPQCGGFLAGLLVDVGFHAGRRIVTASFTKICGIRSRFLDSTSYAFPPVDSAIRRMER